MAREIFVRIHPNAAKENPDLHLNLPASVVTDGKGARELHVGEVAGVSADAILIQRAIRRQDIIETRLPADSKPTAPAAPVKE